MCNNYVSRVCVQGNFPKKFSNFLMNVCCSEFDCVALVAKNNEAVVAERLANLILLFKTQHPGLQAVCSTRWVYIQMASYQCKNQ